MLVKSPVSPGVSPFLILDQINMYFNNTQKYQEKEIGLHTKQLEYQANLELRQLFTILSDNSNQSMSLRRHKIKDEIKTNETKHRQTNKNE